LSFLVSHLPFTSFFRLEVPDLASFVYVCLQPFSQGWSASCLLSSHASSSSKEEMMWLQLTTFYYDFLETRSHPFWSDPFPILLWPEIERFKTLRLQLDLPFPIFFFAPLPDSPNRLETRLTLPGFFFLDSSAHRALYALFAHWAFITLFIARYV